eukprot:m.448199 g.448199  ORF g.448199 m.448199 type:complete len:53 (-) comp56890_c0_seq6:48-206(-)
MCWISSNRGKAMTTVTIITDTAMTTATITTIMGMVTVMTMVTHLAVRTGCNV